MKDLVILTHVPRNRKREVLLRLSSIVESADGRTERA